MFEFMLHEWIAAGISAGTVALFIVLLCVDGYQTYREEERRRQRRKNREARNG